MLSSVLSVRSARNPRAVGMAVVGLLGLGGPLGCGGGKLNAPQRGSIEGDTAALSDGGSGDGDSDGDGVVEHCGALVEDEVWGPPGAAHRIRCTVTVASGALRIEPGVTVTVAQGEGLVIGGEGAAAALEVHGSEEEPVVFTGESELPGAWGGLRLLPGAEARLSGLELHNGGTTNRGALHVDGVSVEVDGLRITGAPSCALRLHGGASLAAGATGLALTGNGLPACAWIDAVSSLPAAAEGNVYTGNELDHVRVWKGEINGQVSWSDLGVPLRIEDTIELAGTAEAPASLRLSPGMVLAFASNKGLTVGAGGHAAALVLPGTAEAPIRLQGGDGSEPGSWGQLALDSGTLPEETLLQHVIIEHGGGRGLAVVEVTDATVSFEALTLRDCAGDALGFHPGAHLGAAGGSLAVSGCDAPVFLAASAVGELERLALELGDFEQPPFVRVRARTSSDAVISQSTVWPDAGIPYRVERAVKVQGGATLTIAAGADLRFASTAGLEVGTASAAGGLTIAGTAASPVFLGAADAELPGAWSGLKLGENTDPETTSIDHLELAYAGRGRRAALWVDGAALTLRNTLIRDVDPEACAISWSGSAPALENVSFENAPGGELCVED